MQTFLISENPIETAKILDNKRLGKQRVEAIQIAYALLGHTKSNAWKNHPAVLMWKGREWFLIHRYLRAILVNWETRGYKNYKCSQHFDNLFNLTRNFPQNTPYWFCKKFFDSHKSNLMRKNSNYYYWPGIPADLPYYWPVTKGV